MPTALLKTLYNLNDRKKNNQLVGIIKSGLSDLKNKIEKMPENEIKIKKRHKIMDTVERSLSLIDKTKKDSD